MSSVMRHLGALALLIGVCGPSWADPGSAPSSSEAIVPSTAAIPPAAETGEAELETGPDDADTEGEESTPPANIATDEKMADDAPVEDQVAELPSAPALRTGFSINVGGAIASCVPSGSADCGNTYPGGSISAAMEIRFWYLGVALEYDYGFHVVTGAGAEDVSSTTMHLMPVLKGYYPLTDWELFVGAGLGYSSMAVTEERTESEAAWSTLWQGLKLTGGAWYDLSTLGMPEGFTLDVALNVYLNSGGERCTEYAGSGPCLSSADLEPSQRDVAHQLQVATALRYTF